MRDRKLVDHYPITGWLWVACSYVTRRAKGVRWEDHVGEETNEMMEDMVRRVSCEDSVGGRWNVSKLEKGVIWCGTSSIANGVMLEISNETVEDNA